MSIFDPDEVITIYSLKQAIEDGALVEIFNDRWKELSGGKPIVASANVFEFESEGALKEIWNRLYFGKSLKTSGFSQQKWVFRRSG